MKLCPLVCFSVQAVDMAVENVALNRIIMMLTVMIILNLVMKTSMISSMKVIMVVVNFSMMIMIFETQLKHT